MIALGHCPSWIREELRRIAFKKQTARLLVSGAQSSSTKGFSAPDRLEPRVLAYKHLICIYSNDTRHPASSLSEVSRHIHLFRPPNTASSFQTQCKGYYYTCVLHMRAHTHTWGPRQKRSQEVTHNTDFQGWNQPEDSLFDSASQTKRYQRFKYSHNSTQ